MNAADPDRVELDSGDDDASAGVESPANMEAACRRGIVHRIDHATTGLLVIAKTDLAMESLMAQFRERQAGRRYVALVRLPPRDLSDPLERVIDAPLERHPFQRARMRVASPGRGRPARTRSREMARFGPFAEVELSLETGRTHQIRVHLAHCAMPVVGDPMYGKPNPKPGTRSGPKSKTGSKTGSKAGSKAGSKNRAATFEASQGPSAAILPSGVRAPGVYDANRANSLARRLGRALGGQALHASTLYLLHPRTGRKLTFHASPPAEYLAARRALQQAYPS